MDESPVEVVTRNEIYADGIKLIDQRYPKPGKQNATVKLGIATVGSNDATWVPLDPRQYDLTGSAVDAMVKEALSSRY